MQIKGSCLRPTISLCSEKEILVNEADGAPFLREFTEVIAKEIFLCLLGPSRSKLGWHLNQTIAPCLWTHREVD